MHKVIRLFKKLLTDLIRWIKYRNCQHQFKLSDLKKTKIKPLPIPEDNDYVQWLDYFHNMTTHDSYTKRVMWPCMKCGKVFYGHCGLDISPDNGKVVKL